jgi:hypothetical protein
LDSVANASRVRLPCVLHCSGRDRVVPPRFQQLILDVYAGPKQVVTVPGADHVFVPSPEQTEEYGRAIRWLREESGLSIRVLTDSVDTRFPAHSLKLSSQKNGCASQQPE